MREHGGEPVPPPGRGGRRRPAAVLRRRAVVCTRARPCDRRGPGSLYRRWKSIQYLATRDRRRRSAPFLRDGARGRRGLAGAIASGAPLHRDHQPDARLSHARRDAGGEPGDPGARAPGRARGRLRPRLQHRQAQPRGPRRRRTAHRLRLVPRPAAQRRAAHGTWTAGRSQFRAGAFRATLPQVQRTVEPPGRGRGVRLPQGLVRRHPAGAARRRRSTWWCSTSISSSQPGSACASWCRAWRRAGSCSPSTASCAPPTSSSAREPFWRDEVGVPPPRIDGLGAAKLLVIRK